MEIKKIYSIRWADENKTGVLIEADTDEALRCLVSTPYSSELSIVWDYIKDIPVSEIEDYRIPECVYEDILEKRLYLLRASDWTQLPDCQLSEEKKAEWAIYRQQLRDITTQNGYPVDVIFPTEPI